MSVVAKEAPFNTVPLGELGGGIDYVKWVCIEKSDLGPLMSGQNMMAAQRWHL